MVRAPLGARQSGFTLLELMVVVVLIGLLSAAGIKYYIDALDKARATGVEMLAWRFAQTAAVLHAWRKIPPDLGGGNHGTDRRGVDWVELDGVAIYLNENGWPANADAQLSPKLENQSVEECQQLLEAMFQSATDYMNAGTGELDSKYDVSVVSGGRSCRYQLAQNKEEAWFFDYSLESGRVRVSVPKLGIEQNAGT